MVIDIGPVTPGITALEYAQRRSKLANKLPQNAIAVLAASEVKYRAAGIFNEYRQDSNFFYLTGMSDIEKRGRQHTDPLLRIGFNEPNALAIIGKPCEERVERLNKELIRLQRMMGLATTTFSTSTFGKRIPKPNCGMELGPARGPL